MSRKDGRKIKTIDPFTKVIPYIMDKRYDATNYLALDFPYEKVTEYIAAKKAEAKNLTVMSCILAAYLRMVSQFPETNRFVIAKKIYARNHFSVSFVILKDAKSNTNEQKETVIKLRFRGDETIFDVADSMNRAIEENRKPSTKNNTDKLLNRIFSTPILPSAIVSMIKWIDRRGLLPKSVIDASPFHTSIFFTNLASIRAYPVYHHLYEFGTTGAFLSLGMDVGKRGQYQMNTGTDERCCSGSTYVKAMHFFLRTLRHLDSLEVPPKTIVKDIP
jgi:hypothetical protein